MIQAPKLPIFVQFLAVEAVAVSGSASPFAHLGSEGEVVRSLDDGGLEYSTNVGLPIIDQRSDVSEGGIYSMTLPAVVEYPCAAE